MCKSLDTRGRLWAMKTSVRRSVTSSKDPTTKWRTSWKQWLTYLVKFVVLHLTVLATGDSMTEMKALWSYSKFWTTVKSSTVQLQTAAFITLHYHLQSILKYTLLVLFKRTSLYGLGLYWIEEELQCSDSEGQSQKLLENRHWKAFWTWFWFLWGVKIHTNESLHFFD